MGQLELTQRSRLAGWGTATFDPAAFVSDQITGQEAAVSDHARLIALQLGNCYGLMFLLGLVVLFTTSELKVIRRYLLALSVTDVTHVAIGYHVLGIERFSAVHQWNSMMWGNIAMPVCSTSFVCGSC